MSEMQRVITFATGKGGTGKTSCAVNVAGLAAAAGWRTLLIDLDSQGNCGHDLGYGWNGRSDEGAGLVNCLVSGEALKPVLSDVRPNLDVIPGGSRLDDLDDLVAGRERRGDDGVSLLRDALRPLAPEYDLVIIDTPPSRRSALVLSALMAARWIVVPTKSDRSSIEGLRKLAEQVVAVRDRNPDLEVLGAVLFGIGSSATVLRQHAADDVRNVLGDAAPLFESVIRHAQAVADDSREKGRLVYELAEVVHNAEPYWIALKEGRRPQRVPGTAPALAEDYALLAQEMLTRIAELEEPSA
ncbi:ParA family protein [Nocardioides hankookensis]|uniref:ParA family protein n=1 Tax=Nocardioides hankookensis TaxID=443157 RepID=A0ABW1LLP2_9ACTN